jgi:hypothetical protein
MVMIGDACLSLDNEGRPFEASFLESGSIKPS